jgi:hypothetical protein
MLIAPPILGDVDGRHCDRAAEENAVTAWSWLVEDARTPLLFSTLGDVFPERESGGGRMFGLPCNGA